MLNFQGPGSRVCDGLSRREILKIGGLGAFGASIGLPTTRATAATTGRAADPWLLNAKPSPEGLTIDEITLPAALSPERLIGRRDLLDRLGRSLDRFSHEPVARAMDSQAKQAIDLFRSPQARAAFRL